MKKVFLILAIIALSSVALASDEDAEPLNSGKIRQLVSGLDLKGLRASLVVNEQKIIQADAFIKRLSLTIVRIKAEIKKLEGQDIKNIRALRQLGVNLAANERLLFEWQGQMILYVTIVETINERIHNLLLEGKRGGFGTPAAGTPSTPPAPPFKKMPPPKKFKGIGEFKFGKDFSELFKVLKKAK